MYKGFRFIDAVSKVTVEEERNLNGVQRNFVRRLLKRR